MFLFLLLYSHTTGQSIAAFSTGYFRNTTFVVFSFFARSAKLEKSKRHRLRHHTSAARQGDTEHGHARTIRRTGMAQEHWTGPLEYGLQQQRSHRPRIQLNGRVYAPPDIHRSRSIVKEILCLREPSNSRKHSSRHAFAKHFPRCRLDQFPCEGIGCSLRGRNNGSSDNRPAHSGILQP